MGPTLLIFCYMWTILFLLLVLIIIVRLLCQSWVQNLLWKTWVLSVISWASFLFVLLQVSFFLNINMLLKFWRRLNGNMLLLLLLHPTNFGLMQALLMIIVLCMLAWLGLHSILLSLIWIFHMLFSKYVYLCMIVELSIWLFSSYSSLISYTDVDWCGCPDTYLSTSGYLFFRW